MENFAVMAKNLEAGGNNYVLCWTKDYLTEPENITVKKVMTEGENGHCHEIVSNSPLALGMDDCLTEADARYLLHKHVFKKTPHAFHRIESKDFHMQLNMGKEWIFRVIFSTGTEQIGPETGATMQSFQTRLKKVPVTSLGEDGPMGFQIVTHVTGCKKGKCYAFDFLNHFHLIKHSDLELGKKENLLVVEEIGSKKSGDDFIRDLTTTMEYIEAMPKAEVVEIGAEEMYKFNEGIKDMEVGIGGFTF